MGAVAALVVALASMVVIMGVYKRAVVKMRKQVALTQLLRTHPDGRALQVRRV
jgi:hypothetical protein